MSSDGDSSTVEGLLDPSDWEREVWRRTDDDWTWIVHRPELLEPYRGQYVAIWDKRIIAHGSNPREVRAQLERGPYWKEPFLAFRVPTREEVAGILVL